MPAPKTLRSYPDGAIFVACFDQHGTCNVLGDISRPTLSGVEGDHRTGAEYWPLRIFSMMVVSSASASSVST